MAVTNDLVTDQRVHRSCSALTEAGYRVRLIGRRLPESLPLDRGYECCRMRLLFRKGPLFYAEYNFRLLVKLLFMRCSLIWANDTDTLPACYLAARIRRKPLWYDAHELFTEVPELVGRDRVKRVWAWIEGRILPNVRYGSTVCGSIAREYRSRYGVELIVVRNVPQQRTPIPKKTSENETMLLYQGAVNMGRGVDWMIEAMRWLDGYCLVVAGDGDELDRMKDLANGKTWRDRIRFVGRLDPDRLFETTCQADLGLSLLADMGLSYRYSLPNRLADFVQAGVPVLATGFPEIARLEEGYGVGRTTLTENPETLAEEVEKTLVWWKELGPDEQLKRMTKAREELSWEKEKKKIINAIDTIFNGLSLIYSKAPAETGTINRSDNE